MQASWHIITCNTTHISPSPVKEKGDERASPTLFSLKSEQKQIQVVEGAALRLAVCVKALYAARQANNSQKTPGH